MPASTVADCPTLPPPVANSVNELANQLILYGIRLQMVGPSGAAVPVRCVRRSAEPLPFGDVLTAGEARIASMATAGSTNREIAQWLRISHKTVEAHLGHIYRKLGVRSRTELAYLLSREHPDMRQSQHEPPVKAVLRVV